MPQTTCIPEGDYEAPELFTFALRPSCLEKTACRASILLRTCRERPLGDGVAQFVQITSDYHKWLREYSWRQRRSKHRPLTAERCCRLWLIKRTLLTCRHCSTVVLLCNQVFLPVRVMIAQRLCEQLKHRGASHINVFVLYPGAWHGQNQLARRLSPSVVLARDDTVLKLSFLLF